MPGRVTPLTAPDVGEDNARITDRFEEFVSLTIRFDWLIVTDAATAGTHPRKGLVEQGGPLSAVPLSHASTLGDAAVARVLLESLVGDRSAAPARR